MYMQIQRFVGQGRPGFVEKLNELVDAVNFLRQIRGDETFINVQGGRYGGLTVGLNINQVLCRIPKPYSSALPVGQYQYQTYQMVSQNQSGFDFTRAHSMT